MYFVYFLKTCVIYNIVLVYGLDKG